ncbi:hypothetical protein Pint_08894 [Pistacia integerrima]|uniref:Uncharacterized protein n=2 Tax=Pistacia TaxID=55512 RepID=A0ACC1AL85_9ROSI|nr:hypothetical protein Pint_08894 [Pistacia integerrima]KAJ0087470.1 hypothetical protein Patl1_09077 [Pistacia atlantica]
MRCRLMKPMLQYKFFGEKATGKAYLILIYCSIWFFYGLKLQLPKDSSIT